MDVIEVFQLPRIGQSVIIRVQWSRISGINRKQATNCRQQSERSRQRIGITGINSKQPGRDVGRAIGKGINRNNLIKCVKFVTGPCACVVKEKDPGVDLLIRCDWTRVAAGKSEKLP